MKIPLFATRLAGNSQLFWKKSGPTVLTGVGVVGIPVAMVLTAAASIKVANTLPGIRLHIATAELEAKEAGKDEKGQAHAVAKAQVEMGLQIAKVYSPAIGVAGVSIACLVISHGMMKHREAQLVGAFVALEAGFKAYRARVAEKLGETEELELYRGAKLRISESDEGTSCIIDYDDTSPSIYAKFFDESCTNWSKSPEYNLTFLRAQQNWANDKLRAQGHLFLNEVYDALGMTRTQAGQIVGWVWDADKHGTGDGYVDFGIYQIADPNNRAFVNGLEHTVGLDFNCDGVIIGKV